MIVLDTSALMAIVLDEPEAAACIAAIGDEEDIAISAGTIAETGTRRPPQPARQ